MLALCADLVYYACNTQREDMMRSLAILLFSLAMAGCNFTADAQEAPSGGGDVTQRTYPLAGFDAVGLAGSPDMIVTVGGRYSVRAEGDPEMLDRLDLRVENGTLKVGYKKGNWSANWGNRAKTRIFVTAPSLRAASLAGSGDIRIDRVQGDSFDASVAGSGDIAIAQMQVGTASFSIAGSGGISAAGGAQTASVSIAGSGDIDAGALQSRTASASVMGSGDVRIRATETANVSIMGSGDVLVSGSARCTVNKRGSGSVRCGA
jgi:hypothetical protein